MGDLAIDAAQALLTGLDTAMSKQWREEDRTWRREDRGWRNEDRKWRSEDLDWRAEEREWRNQETAFREENRRWRREDMEQRHLDNARNLWARYVEKNRRAVEEKGEQLRAVSNLAALIAGFAVVALVELNFEPDEVNDVVMLLFGASTALTVALMTNSMVSCSLMLATILKNGKTYVSEEEEAQYMARCRRWVAHYKPGDRPPAPKRTFNNHWQQRLEDDWKLAFRMFTMGVPCFMSNLAFAAWLKFPFAPSTAAIISAIMGVALLVYLKSHYTWSWYLTGDKGEVTDWGPHIPDGLPFDWHARPHKHHVRARDSAPEATAMASNGRDSAISVVYSGAAGGGVGYVSRQDSLQSEKTADGSEVDALAAEEGGGGQGELGGRAEVGAGPTGKPSDPLELLHQSGP